MCIEVSQMWFRKTIQRAYVALNVVKTNHSPFVLQNFRVQFAADTELEIPVEVYYYTMYRSSEQDENQI